MPPYGIPIITNSSIQILLKQSPTAIDTLKEVFNLTDAEKFTLLESGVGEGIFFAGVSDDESCQGLFQDDDRGACVGRKFRGADKYCGCLRQTSAPKDRRLL